MLSCDCIIALDCPALNHVYIKSLTKSIFYITIEHLGRSHWTILQELCTWWSSGENVAREREDDPIASGPRTKREAEEDAIDTLNASVCGQKNIIAMNANRMLLMQLALLLPNMSISDTMRRVGCSHRTDTT